MNPLRRNDWNPAAGAGFQFEEGGLLGELVHVLGVPDLLDDCTCSGEWAAAADKPVRLDLMAGSVELHDHDHVLRKTDNYFACELRDLVELDAGFLSRWTPSLVGYFLMGCGRRLGCGLRRVRVSVMMVADLVSELFFCPPAWLR